MTFRLAAIDARYPTVVQLVVPTGVEHVCLRVLFALGPASCAAAERSFKAILGPSHTAHAIHNTPSKASLGMDPLHNLTWADIHKA